MKLIGSILMALVASGVLAEGLVPTVTTPTRGAWCSDFAATKARAEAEHVPLLVFCARENCGNCSKMQRGVISDEFVAWAKDRQLYMCFREYTWTEWGQVPRDEGIVFSLTPNKLPELPLMKVYWRQPDGEVLETNFTGTNKYMPWGDPSQTVQASLMKTVDKFLIPYYGYDPTVPRVDESYGLVQGVTVPFDLPQLAGYAVKGLPSGLKWDKATGGLSGAPKKAGTFGVSFSKKGEETVSTSFAVAGLPADRFGTYNGFVGDEGTFAATLTAAGKISAKVVTADGTTTLTASAWDRVEGDVLSADLFGRKGETLSLALDTSKGWDAVALTGEFAGFFGEGLKVRATLNAFAKDKAAQAALAPFVGTWGFDVEKDGDGWSFVEPASERKPQLKVVVQKTGKVKISGTIGSYKVNVQTCVWLLAESLAKGHATAAAIAFVRDANEKRPLRIALNLWVDGPSEHPGELGGASL